jgi:hypothetical protein
VGPSLRARVDIKTINACMPGKAECQDSPMYMHARFPGSVASAISSFTVYSVLSARSSLRPTAVSARSAASSAVPLLISSSGKPPRPGVCAREMVVSVVDDEACARLILNSLAVLRVVFALVRSKGRRRGGNRRERRAAGQADDDGRRTKNAVGHT